MNDKTLRNLQTYIGKRSLGQTDTEVIEHIEEIESKEGISQNEWCKLAYPCCANADIEILKYIFEKVVDKNIAEELILHTVRFRQKSIDYQMKQAQILKMLFKYVSDSEREGVLNDALADAAWFGEYEVVKVLVEEGAKVDYVCSNGKSILELSTNAVKKFGDDRVHDYIQNKLM